MKKSRSDGRATPIWHDARRLRRAFLGALQIIAVPLCGAASSPAATGPDLPALCESAAHTAAAESGVPVSVLRAIALTETGRKRGGKMRPWPWTVNMEGKGKWFDDSGTALDYVNTHFARGARSFDVGCFQINYRWHGQAFDSITEMFDPVANARYAAKFLRQLHAEHGDWSAAAGAYHSRTPEYANRYRKRFDRLRAALEGVAPPRLAARPIPPEPPATPAPPAPLPARVNNFPFLQADARNGRLGSLVPLGPRPGAVRLVALD